MMEEGIDIESCARSESSKSALSNIVMQNSVTSLRALQQLDWHSFFERHSITDGVLRHDPSGYYSRMVFSTRDSYRHAVENLARLSGKSEEEVARLVVAKASETYFKSGKKSKNTSNISLSIDEISQTPSAQHQENSLDTLTLKVPLRRMSHRRPSSSIDSAITNDSETLDQIPIEAHIGFWLMDDGLIQLEKELEVKLLVFEKLSRWVFSHPLHVYFGLIAFYSLMTVLLLWIISPIFCLSLPWLLFLPMMFLFLVEISVQCTHTTITQVISPRILPMLDFVEHAIPKKFRTAVVVPLLLPSVSAAANAVDQLEVHFLSNRDSNIMFGLLTDFPDASSEILPCDKAILEAAVTRICELNSKYPEKCFFMFHRPRLFNPTQGKGIWMAWERKRGKLEQFNEFLVEPSDCTRSAFSKIVISDESLLHDVRYVITLDADTVLPRNAAKSMIGTIAHPLNQAVVDAELRRVVKGYGVMQPRVSTRLNSDCTDFAAVFSGQPGVDPYVNAVSDVYQDLFKEGSFTGKGIYDVRVFLSVTQGRFLPNTVLSHDLIEGTYARSALLTNVEVMDDYPSKYMAASKRKHRWIRGDWQLLCWAIGFLFANQKTRNRIGHISVLSRWKLLDNLRRTLNEMAIFFVFPFVWLYSPSDFSLGGTVLALVFIAFPWILSFLVSLIPFYKPLHTGFLAFYLEALRDGKKDLQQFLYGFAFIPHQALVVMHGISIALIRLWTKRNLLEWTVMSTVEASTRTDALGTWLQMFNSVIIVFSLFIVLILLGSFSFAEGIFIAPIIFAWFLAPQLAYYISTHRQNVSPQQLNMEQLMLTRRYALLHWRYFDKFITETGHWLVPDNFQSSPEPQVAWRTSPTNIGMQLMSIVSAYDFGFITESKMLFLLEHVLDTLDLLPKHKGHIFNWIDIQSMTVLLPAYISSVDSGNLAASLLSVQRALLELSYPVDENIPRRKNCEAILSSLQIVLRLMGTSLERRELPSLRQHVNDSLSILSTTCLTRENIDEKDLLRIVTKLSMACNLLHGHPARFIETEVSFWIHWALELSSTLLNPESSSKRGFSSSLSSSAPRQYSNSTKFENVHRIIRLQKIAERCETFALNMDFSFLYDAKLKLFSIGYDIGANKMDRSLYDLLASESRITSMLAIAKGDVPVEHWFRLGRSLVKRGDALISWSGTMFEYLMPMIWLKSVPNTLLDRSNRAIVTYQMDYTKRVFGQNQVPWGISESAYNLLDQSGNYQYRAFGLPMLALKRGQEKDYVVAPYATMLALPLFPVQCLENLSLFEKMGALGPYGFHDAVDYSRPVAYSEQAIVYNSMAHHAGMSLAMLDNFLHQSIWQHRFHSHPMVASCELLLHERVPRLPVTIVESDAKHDPTVPSTQESGIEGDSSVLHLTDNTSLPVSLLIGTVSFTTLITNSGSGYSFSDQIAVTRWRNDSTCENFGQWIYIRDSTIPKLFSASHMPVCAPYDHYDVEFTPDSAFFKRLDGDLSTWMRCTVSSAHRADLRLVTVRNLGKIPHTVDVITYAELVLQSMGADRQHPAFGNLFVQTEWQSHLNAIIAKRRPRAPNQPTLYCAHTVALGRHTRLKQPVCFETSREKFLGRGSSIQYPWVLSRDEQGNELSTSDSSSDLPIGLSNSAGSVLDPILSLQLRVSIPPGGIVQLGFSTVLGGSLEEVLERSDYYGSLQNVKQAFSITSSEIHEELDDLGISSSMAMLFQQLYSNTLTRHPSLSNADKLFQVSIGQESLWSIGISGDYPIVLVLVESEDGLNAVSQLLLAHRYWRRRGVQIDLVILNSQPPTYLEDLQDHLMSLVHTWSDMTFIDKNGGVFLRRKSLVSEPLFQLLQAISRIVYFAEDQEIKELQLRSLEDNSYVAILAVDPWTPHSSGLSRSFSSSDLSSPLQHSFSVDLISAVRHEQQKNLARESGLLLESDEEDEIFTYGGSIDGRESGLSLNRSLDPLIARDDLLMFNGYGGLNPQNNSYVVEISKRILPPTPWVNIIAGPNGGTMVSESGGGYTWYDNSFFFRLTPWRNDFVLDTPGEVLYLRNDSTGEIWSPTPSPILHDSLYRVTHAPGYSTFEHEHQGLRSKLEVSISNDGATKVMMLSLRNLTQGLMQFTITSYVEWVLGQTRETVSQTVVTFYDSATTSLCSRNPYDSHYGKKVAFSWCSGFLSGFTCDRREFLGRCGTLSSPSALFKSYLMEQTGAGLDPCAVRQVKISLPSNDERSIVLLLGTVGDVSELPEVIRPFATPRLALTHFERSQNEWHYRLQKIQCQTPSPSLNAMINTWSLYQCLSCRFWGRTALYQSGGGLGFRDQLQDIMALLYTEPTIARQHILTCSSHQFLEGDVQHWWHPHNSRGVRTRISDDLVWLPYVASIYSKITGDLSIWDEMQPFLEMRELSPHEEDLYDLPRVSTKQASLYQHCVLAIKRASTFGSHGLPLIGTGDWNDGLNNVGKGGKGESVWLAWFLCATLDLMIPLADQRSDTSNAETWRNTRSHYASAAEAAWDGEWYRRAYFDDGTPLGTSTATECIIDSISQSWSVISGVAMPIHAVQAIESAEKHLVMIDKKVIRLLTPPFDISIPNPGYIQGYIPGVRENGAQYTHAALWLVLANAKLGHGSRAFELLQIINPFTHGSDPPSINIYRGEPYVVAADIYAAPNLEGRAGWTWYTGSASWFYRVSVESILGLHQEGTKIRLDPCIPAHWEEFTLRYRSSHGCIYVFHVTNPSHVQSGILSVQLDGEIVDDLFIHLDLCSHAESDLSTLTSSSISNSSTTIQEHLVEIVMGSFNI